MPKTYPIAPPCAAFDRLAERARVLGAWCLPVAGDGTAMPCHHHWQGIDQTPLGRAVLDAAAAWIQHPDDAAPAQVADAVWAVPVLDPRRLKRKGLAAALTGNEHAATTLQRAGLDAAAADEVTGVFTAARWPDPATLQRTLNLMLGDLAHLERDATAIGLFSGKLDHAYEEIHLLYELARVFKNANNPDDSFHTMCQRLLEITEFTWVAAVFQGGKALPALRKRTLLAGEPPVDSGRVTDAAGRLATQHHAGDACLLLNPDDDDFAHDTGGEVFSLAIRHERHTVGVLLAGNKTGPDPEASSVEQQLLTAASDYMGLFHENAARYEEQRRHFLGTLRALTTAIDAKDPYTRGHSERVAEVASRLAAAAGWSIQEVERVRVTGLVHDVGKIGVPEAILCKPGRCTDEEFDAIRAHPVIGHRILKGIPDFADVLDGVLYHHERWDGRGYPEGKAGTDIPAIGRVLAVADTFDAMSSARSYRKAIPREDVIAEIRKCSGSQFDPDLIEPFCSLDLGFFDAMLEEANARLWAA